MCTNFCKLFLLCHHNSQDNRDMELYSRTERRTWEACTSGRVPFVLMKAFPLSQKSHLSKYLPVRRVYYMKTRKYVDYIQGGLLALHMSHFSNSCKTKEKNEICHSVSTCAVKCDGLFFVLQHGFQYGFQHA